jgi:hypothetical protein
MRKDLVITALLTFCLAAVLLTAIPTRSQETLEYDPWKDINDDGKLDILDLVQISSQYGAQGNPTKNVNSVPSFKVYEAGWFDNEYYPEGSYYNLSWTSSSYNEFYCYPAINTSGYSHMFLYLSVWNATQTSIKIYLHRFTWCSGPSDSKPDVYYNEPITQDTLYVKPQYSTPFSFTSNMTEFEVKGEYAWLVFDAIGDSTGSAQIIVRAYLR